MLCRADDDDAQTERGEEVSILVAGSAREGAAEYAAEGLPHGPSTWSGANLRYVTAQRAWGDGGDGDDGDGEAL